MADSVRVKRGIKAKLPKSLPLGELAFCTDTGELFVGTGSSVKKVIDPELVQQQKELSSQLDNIAIQVEYFRFLVENDDWTKAIRKAIEKAGVSGSIIFNKDTVYTITGQLDFLKNQYIKGNGATLKRANESKSQITVSATSSSSTLTFASVPSDWEVGDMVHIFVGQSMADSSNPRKIKSISGNSVTLESSIGKLIGESNETSSYPIGTYARKTYIMISSQQYPVPYPLKIDNLIIDGNRNNNNSNYYWYCNSGISVYGYGTEIKDCKFYSIPNECIITHGANIINCYAEGLNGSFVHLSSPPVSLGEEFMGTFITNNIVKRSNAIDPAITGHSKAVIEQSWNAGKTTIIGNQFDGCGYGVCFDLLQQTLDNERTYYSEFIIVGNTFKNYSKISDAINSNITWELNNKILTSNVFDNCGTNDFTNLKTKNCIFENNTLSGGTTLTGYSKNIKELYGDSHSQLILSSGASSLSLMHMSNGATYFQKGSTQYFYVDGSGRFILNSDTMVLNSQKGVVKLNDFQLFISDSMTDTPWRNYMNSTYKNLSVGSEVYFPNITTPAIYKKVAIDTWVTIPTTVF